MHQSKINAISGSAKHYRWSLSQSRCCYWFFRHFLTRNDNEGRHATIRYITILKHKRYTYVLCFWYSLFILYSLFVIFFIANNLYLFFVLVRCDFCFFLFIFLFYLIIFFCFFTNLVSPMIRDRRQWVMYLISLRVQRATSYLSFTFFYHFMNVPSCNLQSLPEGLWRMQRLNLGFLCRI